MIDQTYSTIYTFSHFCTHIETANPDLVNTMGLEKGLLWALFVSTESVIETCNRRSM